MGIHPIGTRLALAGVGRGDRDMSGVIEITAGVLAAGVTTTLGFLATKLVIEGMGRKLRSPNKRP